MSKADDRRGDDVVRLALALPEDLPCLGVVAADQARGIGDDLDLASRLGRDRRGPGGLLVAILAPEQLAGLLVEGEDDRLAFVIADHEDRISGQAGRAALTKGHFDLHGDQGLAPLEVPLHVEAVQAP